MRWLLIALAVLAAFNLWAISGIFAHSFYDAACCSDQDCAPLPANDVEEVGRDFFVKSRNELIRFEDTRQGKDDQYHICINHLTGKRICFYRRFNGS